MSERDDNNKKADYLVTRGHNGRQFLFTFRFCSIPCMHHQFAGCGKLPAVTNTGREGKDWSTGRTCSSHQSRQKRTNKDKNNTAMRTLSKKLKNTTTTTHTPLQLVAHSTSTCPLKPKLSMMKSDHQMDGWPLHLMTEHDEVWSPNGWVTITSYDRAWWSLITKWMVDHCTLRSVPTL